MSSNASSSSIHASDWHTYKRLLGYLLPYRLVFLLSIFGFVIYSSMEVLAADTMQLLIDSMGGTFDTGSKSGVMTTILSEYMGYDLNAEGFARIAIPVLLLTLSVSRGIGSFLGQYFINYIGINIVHNLRTEIFNHMVTLPLSFIDGENNGVLISRITYNVNQVTDAVTKALTTLIREGLSVTLLLGYLIYINWKLTLTFLVLAPVIGLIVSYVSRRFRRISKRIQKSMSDVTHVVSEAVNSNRDMRIYGAQETESSRFFDASAAARRQTLKMARTEAAFSPAVQILITMAICILVWLGLSPQVVDSMTPGLFVSFLIAAGAIGKPLKQLTSVVSTIQKALAAATDIFALLDEQAEKELGADKLASVKGDIRFDNVSFTYPSQDKPALKNISFDIQAGEMIALVGGSGGGKSTLASLIPRFYNFDSGDVLLDGKSLKDYQLSNLREHIALVSQHVVLMNDSIRNNIAYGQMKDASEADILRAAKLANAHEFIEKMDQGYDTVVGDNGLMLSGGQRQRLAIARAFLKDAPVLILDEATSALDNDSERQIQAEMNEVAKGRTTIVIAHRLSTIERADRILVIDGGEIVEQGKHQALLERKGRYFELHQSSLDASPSPHSGKD